MINILKITKVLSDYDRFFLDRLNRVSSNLEVDIDQEALYLFICYRENYTEILASIENRISASNGCTTLHLTLSLAKQITTEIHNSISTSIAPPSTEVTTLFENIEKAIRDLSAQEKYKTGKKITLTAIAVQMDINETLYTKSPNLKQILSKKIQSHEQEITALLKHDDYKDQWLEIRKITTFKRLVEGRKIQRKKSFGEVVNKKVQVIGNSETDTN